MMKRFCALLCVFILLAACGRTASAPQTQPDTAVVFDEREVTQPYTTEPETESAPPDTEPRTSETVSTRAESAAGTTASKAPAATTEKKRTQPTSALTTTARESQTYFTIPATTVSRTTAKPAESTTASAASETTSGAAAAGQTTAEDRTASESTTGTSSIHTTTTRPFVTQTSTAPYTKVPHITSAKKTCTVTINCTQLRDHPEKLKEPEKQAFVPSNGYIVRNVTVTLSGGETVYDVLREVCRTHTCTDNCRFCQGDGIQMDSSYSPQFDSYYVEGIHQLYEKDCGGTSGWVYYVNGQFPNVGSSAYPVSPGDRIEWVYSIEQSGIQ